MEIWPMENEVDLEIQNFVDAKIRREKIILIKSHKEYLTMFLVVEIMQKNLYQRSPKLRECNNYCNWDKKRYCKRRGIC